MALDNVSKTRWHSAQSGLQSYLYHRYLAYHACPLVSSPPPELQRVSMKQNKTLLPILAGLWLGCAMSSAAEERLPSANEVHFFETRIRPLLSNHCFDCHGPQKQKSGLRLDS